MLSDFNHDLDLIINKLRHREMFSLVRYADGEYNIFQNRSVDFTNREISEFKYNPLESNYHLGRKKLIQSIKYKDKNYYVGIISPCCYYPYIELYQWMKTFSGQPESNLTWASIFTYANYDKTHNELLPEFNNYNVVLVANKKGDFSKLPFKTVKEFKVGVNAWVEDYYILEEIKKYVIENNINSFLFICCAGPLSKILINEMHMINNNNIYLDLGATLDTYLFNSQLTRKFQWRKELINHHCIWY